MHLTRAAWTHFENAMFGVGHAYTAFILHDATRVIPDSFCFVNWNLAVLWLDYLKLKRFDSARFWLILFLVILIVLVGIIVIDHLAHFAFGASDCFLCLEAHRWSFVILAQNALLDIFRFVFIIFVELFNGQGHRLGNCNLIEIFFIEKWKALAWGRTLALWLVKCELWGRHW